MNTPILETDRLLLRTFEETDAVAVFEGWESDPEVAKYMFWTSHNDIEKTKQWIKKEMSRIGREDWYRWAFVCKETDQVIGTGLVYYEEEVSGWEIAYNLGRKYWGKGYATEGMKEILRFAKESLEIAELIARYAKENTSSGNVLRKLGFIYEADIPSECNNGAVLREGIKCRLKLDA